MPNILIIDDDEMMCATLTALVVRKGHCAFSAMTLGDGFACVADKEIDVVFLDVQLPDGSGLDALSRIEASPSSPEVIIVTGFGDPNGAELAINSGAWDYIEKGFSAKEISLSLERALQYRQEKKLASQSHNTTSLQRDRIIGNSVKLRACLDLVAQAAQSDATVFITGETGTGKELFAHAVHQNSHRKAGSFVVVDCTSLPETLVESLLFGHAKGSFTGADNAQQGLVQQAHGGTLFLDEVGELPLVLQKAFLRVLQEHRFRPLGSNQEVESDFRLVAATNRNLDQLVADGLFRSDLLFRLRSFTIELPPLRERREDIDELCRYHLDKFCTRYGYSEKTCSPDFTATLNAYPWPGNVREFINVLDRTVAAARFETTLFPKYLPSNIRIQVTRSGVGNGAGAETVCNDSSAQQLPTLQDYRDAIYQQAEKQYLKDLMTIAAESIPEACRVSGLSQSRLYALLKKNSISRHA
jgi:two-component system NtrC family response regulator